MKLRIFSLIVFSLTSSFSYYSIAQAPVRIGGGSIAAFPPAYKAKTIESNNGFNATAMLSRKIYADEKSSSLADGIEVPERPLPTNDWWTDIINNQYSGALWSYPAMLSTSDAGVRINWPSYWADMGKEIKSKTNLTVSAKDFRAAAAIAKDWHDWDVVVRFPSSLGKGEITMTSVHGSPFTWFEFSDLVPRIDFNLVPSFFGRTAAYAGIRLGDDLYGMYFPEGASWKFADGKVTFEHETEWVVIALLRHESDLQNFAPYACSVPRATRVDWNYDEASSCINTEWSVSAENLRDAKAQAPVMQGFLPHVYKYMLPSNDLSFYDSEGFITPRGRMLTAASSAGTFRYSYRFSGMLPIFGAPDGSDGFRKEVLDKLMADYASGGTFGGDTYWGGKGLVQMAMNMWFAREAGNQEVFETSKTKLKETLVNWLTYTPGENSFFFSYYPRWGAMLGFDVSYDSDAFNDHHFHYGYFTYAAALLCMVDADFASNYGELLTMIAKDYANWDREDTRFPFLRTLDPWNGHSWAGGLGDHGNDNGNGQESSSEAMQGWGGIFLLGVALDNKEMRDAGIYGWSTEARATREYWFDVDAPRPANAGGRQPWAGKGGKEGNYNYDDYPYAYNSNITGKGIGWWTWFGGDPLFMHGIQWMPVSPALDYLSWDTDFTAWALDDMLSGANSTFSHAWFEDTANSANGERIEPLAANDWGNVALAYMQRSDPKGAAAIFDKALAGNWHIANSISTSHISYYTIHSHLTYGEPVFSCHADISTAQVFVKDGTFTYFVYNPSAEDRTVHFYDENGNLLKTVIAPGGRLAGISAEPVPTGIEYKISDGSVIPPGGSATVSSRIIDQYGAGIPSKNAVLSLSAGAPAILSGNVLRINDNATRGSSFSLYLAYDDIIREEKISVNNPPLGVKARITALPDYCEKDVPLYPEFIVTDQYGNEGMPSDTQWQLISPDGSESAVSTPLTFNKAGRYSVRASSKSLETEAMAQLTVTPPQPLVSLGAKVAASSAENVGTMPEGLCDGNTSTRWGSAHTDNEWIVADLGEECFISRIAILWEAAYGSHYLIETAPDGCSLVQMNVVNAGQNRTVTVPAESEWSVGADVSISSPGEKISILNTKGRYIRIKGLARGTSYGYSIYELSAFGLPSSASASDILGIDFSLPPTLNRNEKYSLNPKVFAFDGSSSEAEGVAWKSDKNASFSGNIFIPLEPGMHTVTASLPGENISSECKVFVNDTERPVGIQFEKEAFTVIEGDPLYVPFTLTNQFMAPFTGDLDFLDIFVLDSDGFPSDKAKYDCESMIFLSPDSGDYTIVFGDFGSCKVSVVKLRDVNLALERPVSTSSVEGWNVGSNAVDGKTSTRWESSWDDNQWIEVDLGNLYLIDRATIIWEGAYAKKYSISASADGENWTEFIMENNGKGQTENLSFEPIQARYVRLNCISRALTAYGFSIWEFEIYGLQRLDSMSTGIESYSDETMEGTEFYNLQGIRISSPTPGQPVIIRRSSNSSKLLLP